MKKVLIYSNRKCIPRVWDVSTEELAAGAFVSLVKYLNEEWQVYGDSTTDHWDWRNRALAGDAYYALRLLQARRSYEYEYWEIREVHLTEGITSLDFKRIFSKY